MRLTRIVNEPYAKLCSHLSIHAVEYRFEYEGKPCYLKAGWEITAEDDAPAAVNVDRVTCSTNGAINSGIVSIGLRDDPFASPGKVRLSGWYGGGVRHLPWKNVKELDVSDYTAYAGLGGGAIVNLAIGESKTLFGRKYFRRGQPHRTRMDADTGRNEAVPDLVVAYKVTLLTPELVTDGTIGPILGKPGTILSTPFRILPDSDR